MATKKRVNTTITVKSDRYYIIVSYYVKAATGKKQRKQKWIATEYTTADKSVKRKLEDIRKDVQAEYESKICDNYSDILFTDYLKLWIEQAKTTIQDSTYCEYKKTIVNTICPYFEESKIKLSDLEPCHIQEFYDYKIKNGTGANTIKHYQAYLHRALRDAVRTKRIKENPANADFLILPKVEKHIAHNYNDEQLLNLLRHVRGHELEPVVVIASYLGLRRGEIIGLKWECIDFKNKTLTILGTVKDKSLYEGSKIRSMYYQPTAKNQSSLRTFPLSEGLCNYLLNLKVKHEHEQQNCEYYNDEWLGFVCVRPNGDLIPLDYVTRCFPKITAKAGLPRLTIHELRHTNVSVLLEKGAGFKALQVWSGHSTYKTTMDTYAHLSMDSKQELTNIIGSVLDDELQKIMAQNGN